MHLRILKKKINIEIEINVNFIEGYISLSTIMFTIKYYIRNSKYS